MIDHLADLESDFSALHRVDDIYQLDGPRFFRMAWRLSAYEGVMKMRIVAQQAELQASPVTSSPAVSHAPSSGAKVVELAALMHSCPDVIDRRKVG